jgi:FkbM family methyltransferase
MREVLWLRLRKSPLLRRLYASQVFTGSMKALSYLLVPSQGTRILRVRGGPGRGLLFELNPRWEIPTWDGSYEMEVQRVLQERLKPGSVLYDVGANIGFYSLLAARLGAQVCAFEPDVQNAESLARHARLNSLGAKIEVIRAAVFSTSGFVGLEPADSARGHGNAHVGTNTEHSNPTVQVPCTTLDDFAREHIAPDTIKIDVEGAESNVLKGSEKIFSDSRPYLICEVHDPANASFIEPWLKTRGYELRWLDTNNSFPRQLLAAPK